MEFMFALITLTQDLGVKFLNLKFHASAESLLQE
jgi:hypothetical protein